MALEFTRVQLVNGATIMLDVWPHMPHDFQAMDSLDQSARADLARIVVAVRGAIGQADSIKPSINTVANSSQSKQADSPTYRRATFSETTK